jgi:chromosome partitioning protein
MMATIAIANHKGGVGKTTATLNLAAALAERGVSVLVVDLDPQGGATFGLGVTVRDGQRTILESLGDEELPLDDAIVHVASPWRIDVVPATLDLAQAEMALQIQLDGERALRRALAPIRDRYGVVLLDCPPSLGQLTINGLTAADRLLVPVETAADAIHAGVLLLRKTLPTVQRRLNENLTVLGVMVTNHDDRSVYARDALEQLRSHYGPLVFDAVVPSRVAIRDSMGDHHPVIVHRRPTAGAVDAYRALAMELLGRLDGQAHAVA